MAEFEELIEQARSLGAAIAANSKVKAYFEAQNAVYTDADARQLLTDYNEAAEKIRRLESEQKPIEAVDKHKLADCEQRLASNDTVKTWMRRQADYFEVMTQVNRAMEEPLAQSAPGQPQS